MLDLLDKTNEMIAIKTCSLYIPNTRKCIGMITIRFISILDTKNIDEKLCVDLDLMCFTTLDLSLL